MAPKIVSRDFQAKKILSIIKDYLAEEDLRNKQCLEVGCGSGKISAYLAKHVKIIWGVDVFLRPSARKLLKGSSTNIAFSNADGTFLPFDSNCFDIVILAQVYEHTIFQQEILDEVFRVLKPGGVCFFSGPNRLQIIEPHYFLPFLTWMPHTWASLYLKLMKKGNEFDVYPRNYWYLKNLTRKFRRVDYSLRLLYEPGKYHFSNRIKGIRFDWIPIWLLKLLLPFIPNYNWILVKNHDK